jgi:hypothetical protein
MTASSVYRASPIRRVRATKAEIKARREALLDIIDAGRPMTVRQVFYQATVRRDDASRLRASQAASSLARSGRASASQFVLWGFRSCARRACGQARGRGGLGEGMMGMKKRRRPFRQSRSAGQRTQ